MCVSVLACSRLDPCFSRISLRGEDHSSSIQDFGPIGRCGRSAERIPRILVASAARAQSHYDRSLVGRADLVFCAPFLALRRCLTAQR
jgi:hypothetical protein